ncbi:MAG: hypothetical protein N2376_00365 [Clostridia bacterium]|nr:hypothetical protein [Clostridia bacterium]
MEFLMSNMEYLSFFAAPIIAFFLYKSRVATKKDKYNVTKYIIQQQRHKESIRLRSKSMV